MSERPIRMEKDLDGFRAWREGNRVYVQIQGYRPVYLCRYVNEKATAAVVKGWARSKGFDV